MTFLLVSLLLQSLSTVRHEQLQSRLLLDQTKTSIDEIRNELCGSLGSAIEEKRAMSPLETKELTKATKKACKENIFGFSPKLCKKIESDGVVPTNSEEFMMSIVQACPHEVFQQEAPDLDRDTICKCFENNLTADTKAGKVGLKGDKENGSNCGLDILLACQENEDEVVSRQACDALTKGNAKEFGIEMTKMCGTKKSSVTTIDFCFNIQQFEKGAGTDDQKAQIGRFIVDSCREKKNFDKETCDLLFAGPEKQTELSVKVKGAIKKLCGLKVTTKSEKKETKKEKKKEEKKKEEKKVEKKKEEKKKEEKKKEEKKKEEPKKKEEKKAEAKKEEKKKEEPKKEEKKKEEKKEEKKKEEPKKEEKKKETKKEEKKKEEPKKKEEKKETKKEEPKKEKKEEKKKEAKKEEPKKEEKQKEEKKPEKKTEKKAEKKEEKKEEPKKVEKKKEEPKKEEKKEEKKKEAKKEEKGKGPVASVVDYCKDEKNRGGTTKVECRVDAESCREVSKTKEEFEKCLKTRREANNKAGNKGGVSTKELFAGLSLMARENLSQLGGETIVLAEEKKKAEPKKEAKPEEKKKEEKKEEPKKKEEKKTSGSGSGALRQPRECKTDSECSDGLYCKPDETGAKRFCEYSLEDCYVQCWERLKNDVSCFKVYEPSDTLAVVKTGKCANSVFTCIWEENKSTKDCFLRVFTPCIEEQKKQVKKNLDETRQRYDKAATSGDYWLIGSLIIVGVGFTGFGIHKWRQSVDDYQPLTAINAERYQSIGV